MILYWLRILSKTYISRIFRIHYSQFGEDVILRDFIKKQKKGFYVDVGCWHPKRFSNTYWLYKRGWRGINIDMEHMKIAMFNLSRKQDINVVAAISDRKKKLYIQRTYNFDLGSSLVKKYSELAKNSIITKTLNEVIGATKYKDHKIDLLSIDAENHDYFVLNSLNWKKYNPKWVIVESWETNIHKILNSKINKFMEDKGYLIVSWTVKSLIYAKK